MMKIVLDYINTGLALVIKSSEIKIKKFLGLPIRPIFINFLITYKCDSRCSMCHIWRKYQDKPKLEESELTTEEIENFFKLNKDYLTEVKHIGITGGEPLLRDDLVKIVKIYRKYLPWATTGFQTNGLSPNKVKQTLEAIKKFYPKVNISVSLDGIGVTHDAVRGVKGAFGKVINTFQILKDLKIKRVTSGMTLSRLNYQEIEKVKDITAKYGIEFSCFLADRADYFNNNSYSTNLPISVKREIKNTLEKNFSDNYFMDNLGLLLDGEKTRRLPCYSGYTSIAIDPYGNVKPCILRSEVFGNIRNSSLKEILWSKKAKKLRHKLKNCRCWNQCEVSSSAMIDLADVFRWFITSRGKKKFLEHLQVVKKDLNL